MNYIKELNAFYDWLELNELSPSAINLWYALMHINNKAGWTETFTVAESVLCVKTGLTDRTLRKVRNELKQKGRIDFVSRKGGKAPIYNIIPFEPSEKSAEINSEELKATEINSAGSAGDSSVGRSAGSAGDSSALIKQNKTKQNETKKEREEERARDFREVVSFFEQNGFGAVGGYIGERMAAWIDDMSKEIVIEAMKTAVENGAKTWGYVETILRDWCQKGVQTVEQARAVQLAFKEQRSKNRSDNVSNRRKTVRTEMLPEWFNPDYSQHEDEKQPSEEELERKRRELEERLKKYRKEGDLARI
ncbi:DnaD domain protein [Anoxybacteroides tepidamans]|uniref:DnaD domain protein n=1 Tax=Anoxybacteroides tepidamans TaxID=265948 RepID=UPI000686B79D|nr:DnaD domain protein [Anoxybacillus tepidamans]